jgi:branched-chain amino acid transport system substrate-binding protein
MYRMFQKSLNQLFFLCTLALSLPMLLIGEETSQDKPQEDKSSIKIGDSNDFTNTSAFVGKRVVKGIEIYFNKINASGGIDGRKIEFIALDDLYEPLKAAKNMHQLIDHDKVLALVGNGGTPTNLVSIPIANEKKTLLFGPYAGTIELYKSPPDRYIFTLMTSYNDMAAEAVKGIISNGIKPEEIAFYTQNDAFGDSIYHGALKALKESGYSKPELLPHGRFIRNSVNVEGGLASIMREARLNKNNVKVIFMAAGQDLGDEFVKKAHVVFPEAIFITIGGNLSYIPDVTSLSIIGLPSVADKSLPAVKEYDEDIKNYKNLDLVGDSYHLFYGYIDAKIFVEGLKRASAANNLTREGIVDALETIKDFDAGIGVNITLSKNNHRILNRSWPVLITDKDPEPIQWTDIPKLMEKAKHKK